MSSERRLLKAAAKGSVRSLKKIFSKHRSKDKVRSRDRHDVSEEEEKEESISCRSKKRKASFDEDIRRKKRCRKEKAERLKSRKRDRKNDDEEDLKQRTKSREVAVDINCCDGAGWTPLHHAAHAGAFEAAKFLISQGADLSARDYRGRVPADVAQPLLLPLLRRGSKGAGDAQPSQHYPHVKEDVFAEEWCEHLRGNVSDDGAGWEDQWGGDEEHAWEGSTWYDDVAAAMRAKKAEELRQSAQRSWQKSSLDAQARLQDQRERERHAAEREQEAQRILAEEEAKDRAWRSKVLAIKQVEQRARYVTRWTGFAASCNLGLGLMDIPFPVPAGKECDMRDVLLQGVPLEEHRKIIRGEILKWHPDKFLQKWGARLDSSAKADVMARVTAVFHAVQAIYESFSALALQG